METKTPPHSSADSGQAAALNAALNKVTQDARDIIDKVSGIADDTARKAIPAATQFAHKTVDDITAKAEPATAWLTEQAERLDAAQEKLLDDARQYIRENPLKSVGIALAAGFLISSLIRKR